MKRKRWFIVGFLAPAVFCVLLIFLYPVIRTFLMSFNKVSSVTESTNLWIFNGIENYKQLFASKVFLQSLINVTKIWLIWGVIVLLFSLLFSVILTSGVKGKSFWRSMLYLPNVISAVALAAMWLYYVFDNKYGLFKTVFSFFGLTSLANFQWTAPENLFTSMMIAVTFGAVGYYVLILVAGIENIPNDYYEAATIEGANVVKKLLYITLPLLKDIIKRCIVFWSAGAIGFFIWSSLFSFNTEMATVTPVVYMYDMVFGKTTGNSQSALDVGVGAAVGVIVMVIVLIINSIINFLFKSNRDEN